MSSNRFVPPRAAAPDVARRASDAMPLRPQVLPPTSPQHHQT